MTPPKLFLTIRSDLLMLNYSFGLHLDGHFSPASIREAGSIICGPMSLLGHLETALGIPPPKGRYLQRLMDYLRAMEQVRGEHDFYSKSIEIAPLATARLVLKMRDELREAGWDGLNDKSKPERIASLARVEIPFSRMQGISSCVSRRIETIIKELRSCPTRIAKITVTDPPDLLPRCWVDLLTELNSDFTNPLPRETISSKRTSLEYLQASLLNETSAPPPYDQTVKLITCATREKAAHTLASELSFLPREGVTLIANTKNQALLNHFLRRKDIPRPSAVDDSSDCILQLVLLYLRMRSPKLDAKAYSEFCLHPTSPVPVILGNALADTIQKKPGYGEHWQQALTGVLEKCQPDHQNWIKDSYELWLDRSQLLPELPTGREITIALEPLVDWVSKEAQLASTAQREIWQSAAHSIQELVTTLDCKNLPPLEDLDDLLSCWLMSASNGITFNGEVGSVNHVTSASQLLEASDHIICGPMSLLGHLETALGIPPPKGRYLQRLMDYLRAMEQVRGEHDFYSKSIEIAPLATARLVLKMRDELREAGWDGLNDKSKPERIASLARVEIPFSRMQGISSCVSRRIETIIKELRSCPTRIAKITVTDPPDLLPRCWGPTQQRAEQRLLNLSGFRELIEKYQETMSTTACPVTLTGLFSWFEDIADDPKNRPQDKCPVDPDINAVYVGTYHGSKGLEWPVVFTTELDTETRTRLFALQAHNDQSQFTLSNPLANRNLRQWITPLPNKKNNLVRQALEQSKIGQAAMEKSGRMLAKEEFETGRHLRL
ncbi:hypothetical protein N9150_03140 [Akkermansiaceae bacterium]|nr:hypothetical protein [Akkermansiaceae bacterium]